jgi:hypothetical protein
MLYYKFTIGKNARNAYDLADLKAKTKRRALRYFRGVEVKHRVVNKDANSIEFAFFRRSGTRLQIRWRRVETTPQVKSKPQKKAVCPKGTEEISLQGTQRASSKGKSSTTTRRMGTPLLKIGVQGRKGSRPKKG